MPGDRIENFVGERTSGYLIFHTTVNNYEKWNSSHRFSSLRVYKTAHGIS
jgi:hypothetical protein